MWGRCRLKAFSSRPEFIFTQCGGVVTRKHFEVDLHNKSKHTFDILLCGGVVALNLTKQTYDNLT